jgi:uncharacterized protein YybS (DUF2232 family)
VAKEMKITEGRVKERGKKLFEQLVTNVGPGMSVLFGI